MAWSMDKEKYFKLKEQEVKDSTIARENFISLRTLDRWKEKEGIVLGINGTKRREQKNVSRV